MHDREEERCPSCDNQKVIRKLRADNKDLEQEIESLKQETEKLFDNLLKALSEDEGITITATAVGPDKPCGARTGPVIRNCKNNL